MTLSEEEVYGEKVSVNVKHISGSGTKRSCNCFGHFTLSGSEFVSDHH